jgi:hypothetical protein
MLPETYIFSPETLSGTMLAVELSYNARTAEHRPPLRIPHHPGGR